jgi:hypothetical protein
VSRVDYEPAVDLVRVMGWFACRMRWISIFIG